MAGIHLFRSNRVEALVALLGEQLARTSRLDADPLRPVEIAVGSPGMERHLRHVLAERLGVCANVDFPFPMAALDAAMPASEPARDPWSRAVLAWAIADVLPDAAKTPGCEALAGYLTADGPLAHEVDGRAYGLALRLAELFDRYVTYRPDMAIAWSAGRDDGIEHLAGQQWQPLLWRAVRSRLGEARHRAERLSDAFGRGEPSPGSLPPMRLFALSSLPASWLGALAQVARARDVELYLLCATPGYVDLDDDAHPLLSSWGRVARDMQSVLDALPDGVVRVAAESFPSPIVSREGAVDDTTLHLLQEDLCRAAHPRLRADFAHRTFDPHDRTVQLHDCHGAMRQVEVLRDVLLGLLTADSTLQPRDIVVMTPDVDAFAPVFASVFDRGERSTAIDGSWDRSGTPRIPYQIVDLTMRRLNPVADALLRVLALVDGRATASEVLDLLALEPVAARFGFNGEDVARARTWIDGAGIRWGVDAAHRVAHGQPEDLQNTWRFGLDRLLLGVVMRDDGRQVADIRPFEAVEGVEVALLGALCDFSSALFMQIDALRAARPVADWVSALDRVVSTLTLTTGKGAWLTRRVREELVSIAEESSLARAERAVMVSGIRAALEGRFEVAAASVHGSGGAITFCGMVPERSVPHRVVALVGMDEGAFPRRSRPLAFDLTGHPPRVGDRSVREEDRYLLLEAVLSARDHLIVLFTGRDARSNKPLPPAVPVSELDDTLDVMWRRERGDPLPSQVLTTQHPLQAFDSRNFVGGSDPTGAPWTFDRRLLAGARAALGPRSDRAAFLAMDTLGPPRPGPADALHLDDLVAFWRHPVRAFLRQRIGMSLPWDDGDSLVDREPIELDWIDHAVLLRQVLAHRRSGRPLAELRSSLRGGGALPLGRLGQAAFSAVVALSAGLEAEAQRAGWNVAASRSADIDVTVGETRLVGRISDVVDGGIVAFEYGAEKPAALLDAWLRLHACAEHLGSSAARARVLFGAVKSTGAVTCTPIGLDLTERAATLAAMCALREQGLDRPLRYFPKASHALAKAAWSASTGLLGADRDADRIEAGDWSPAMRAVLMRGADAARRAWEQGERTDSYYRHAFGETLPFLDATGAPDAAFAAVACRVWGPILEARRTPSVMAEWEAR